MLMSSFDKTMKFNFPEEPFERDVQEVLSQVYVALQEKGYNIARRTVAKYREQLNIPVARLRKEL